MENVDRQIGTLMQGFRSGEKGSVDQLFELLYPELRRLAVARMRAERPEHSWQPTLLVNELYLELLKRNALGGNAGIDAEERAAFLGLAGFLMKRLLILHSRPLRQKITHTGESELEQIQADTASPESLQFVEGVLSRVESIDPKLRSVLEMRVFEGKSHDEIAAQMGCSTRTVGAYWSFARRMLANELAPASRP